MKILTKTTGEAYQRFLDEMKVMLYPQGTDGVLPVIDFYLPELYFARNEFVYFAMDVDVRLCVLHTYTDTTEVLFILHKMMPREV